MNESTSEEQGEKKSRVPAVVVVALIGAVATVATALITAGGGSTPPAAPTTPPPSVTTVAPTSTPEPTFPPAAQGVDCQPGPVEYVRIESVRAEDGGPTLGGRMVLDISIVQEPRAGGSYWLMVLLPQDPRPINIAKMPLDLGRTPQSVVTDIASGVDSVRSFYVAESTAETEAWFVENQRLDRAGDSSRDGDRLELPEGATRVSNVCEATRLR